MCLPVYGQIVLPAVADGLDFLDFQFVQLVRLAENPHLNRVNWCKQPNESLQLSLLLQLIRVPHDRLRCDARREHLPFQDRRNAGIDASALIDFAYL